ncbi:MAG: hypothetical protein ISN29_07415 [Gammaproteobacteria bacterium AqS3]|nr:hypothetical protein [Gammaproteobacteria bacterium AqS3]
MSESNRISLLSEIYQFTDVHQYKLSLQKHAYARLVRSSCRELMHSPFKSKLFFDALLGSDFYQYNNVGYLSLPAAGVHGPFLTERMSSADYQLLPDGAWFSQIMELIQQPKWQLPRLENDQAVKVMNALGGLFRGNITAYRLTLCDDFNRLRTSARAAHQYHHEWSHALSEFHEYVLIDLSEGTCDCLIFAYE